MVSARVAGTEDRALCGAAVSLWPACEGVWLGLVYNDWRSGAMWVKPQLNIVRESISLYATVNVLLHYNEKPLSCSREEASRRTPR
jgi:hypothetical protein